MCLLSERCHQSDSLFFIMPLSHITILLQFMTRFLNQLLNLLELWSNIRVLYYINTTKYIAYSPFHGVCQDFSLKNAFKHIFYARHQMTVMKKRNLFVLYNLSISLYNLTSISHITRLHLNNSWVWRRASFSSKLKGDAFKLSMNWYQIEINLYLIRII